jgi:hypothetical protein
VKTVLLIPDGIGVRNFLLSNFLQQVAATDECHILHSAPEHMLDQFQPAGAQAVHWHPIQEYIETPLTAGLRYAVGYAHMMWGGTQAMRHTLGHRIGGSLRNRAMHHGAKLLARALAYPAGVQLLDRWHCRAVNQLPVVEHYRRLFARLQPSIVFCSHQRPPIVVPPVLAARSLGIPTATFIFSWDNLTSKGRIAAPFDHFLVWSDLMRKELLRYYPDIQPEQVHIVGTPQFDPYADRGLHCTRAEFCARVGADPARPLLCYSGGDAKTAPEDQEHVRILLELIRSGEIKGQPQVLLRPAPVDEGSRYDAVRRAFPELLYAKPAWVHTTPGDWSRVIPQAEDIRFLANLIRHADLNVNLASTMTLDFAIHDKPVVNVAFDVADPPIHGKPLWDFFYQFEHYRPVSQLGAARIARSRAELATHVNTYLDNPALDSEGRRQFVELEVGLLAQSTAAAVKQAVAGPSAAAPVSSPNERPGQPGWRAQWPRSAPEILRVLQELAQPQ